MSGFVGSTSCFLNSSMLLHGTLRSSFSNATSLLFLWICKFCSLGQFRISEFLKLGGRERRTFRLCSSFFFFFKHLVRSRCKIIYKILLCSHIPSENWQSRILNVPISRTRKMRLRLWRKGPSWELALCLISLGETKSRETPLLCPVFLRARKTPHIGLGLSLMSILVSAQWIPRIECRCGLGPCSILHPRALPGWSHPIPWF